MAAIGTPNCWGRIMGRTATGSIRERGKGAWEISIPLPATAEGQRRRHVETVKGKKSDAERRKRELLTAMDAGTLDESEYTVGEWVSKWLASPRVRRDLKLRSIEHYESVTRLHIIPAIGKVKLAKIKPHHVQDLYDEVEAKGIGASTIGVCRLVMKGALDWAMVNEEIRDNPTRYARPPKREKKPVTIPALDDVENILALAYRQDHYLYAAMWLAAYAGMRRGEIMGLRWENVDLLNGKIRVCEQRTVSETLGVVVETPKSKSSIRELDIDVDTVAVLEAHRRAVLDDTGLVFTTAKGLPVHPNLLSRAVKVLGMDLGITIHLHAFRHFHASLLLSVGENPAGISERMGHTNTAVTLSVYSHAIPGESKALATVFAARMRAARNGGNMAAMAAD